MTKSIEVEVRSVLTQQEYERLLKFFRAECEMGTQDEQETYYLHADVDIRIQRNAKSSKIHLKGGQLHDDAREELEIHCHRDDFHKLEKMFLTLGHGVKVKWSRMRHTFLWNDITVCLDATKGYGYIVELERMTHEKDKDAAIAQLRDKLLELGITQTPKEEFRKKYEHYLEHWKELIEKE